MNSLFYIKMSKNESRRYCYLFIFLQFLYVLQLTVLVLEIIRLENLTNMVVIMNGIGWIIFGSVKKLPIFLSANIAIPEFMSYFLNILVSSLKFFVFRVN
ncbi:hypothetical protein [Oceanobacillus sp. J11TS1]|uniref:hypothetical protein n=1 Tax=Oceanobacillus sp. J11TS1 TaxID=2807191 RepID=UPI001B15F0C0|nr:hypothetical protein [Oceanobacillus sp. J11TS1]GIO23113.1 hypothetical protein J11TS1_16940 [Oceanobacillus sp. J11TS1]